MNYTIRTRNFNQSRRVRGLISLIAPAQFDAPDNDTKHAIATDSAARAWLVWALFMALRHWSGGWTYIERKGATAGDGKYRAIYWRAQS